MEDFKIKVAITQGESGKDWEEGYDEYEVTPMLQSKTIRFKKIEDGRYYARSGPIKCDKGFKVRFDLRTPLKDRNDWRGTWIYLIDSQVPLKDYRNMINSVWKKEDPSVHCYGVLPEELILYNLKQEWMKEKGGKINYYNGYCDLPSSSPITMEYDRQAQTVRFTSSHFKLYQTQLPKDVTFVIGVFLAEPPMMLDARFEKLH